MLKSHLQRLYPSLSPFRHDQKDLNVSSILHIYSFVLKNDWCATAAISQIILKPNSKNANIFITSHCCASKHTRASTRAGLKHIPPSVAKHLIEVYKEV